MDITVKLESFKNVADLVLPLMENHYKETSIFAQQKPFKLNTALYFEHEANESFKFLQHTMATSSLAMQVIL